MLMLVLMLMLMLGEDERSVVGYGEVLLTCTTNTMIVVSEHGVDLGEQGFSGDVDLNGEVEKLF